MSKVYIGGCLCGSIRFTASSPNNSHTCSCDICRKHTGAPTVVWIEFDAENVREKPENRKPGAHQKRPVGPFALSAAVPWAPSMTPRSLRF